MSDLKLMITHTIVEDLRVQHPGVEQIDNERGDLWLPGGSTPQSSGCVIDVHSIAQSVEREVRAALTPGHTDLMVSPESIDAFLEANPPSAAVGSEGAGREPSEPRLQRRKLIALLREREALHENPTFAEGTSENLRGVVQGWHEAFGEVADWIECGDFDTFDVEKDALQPSSAADAKPVAWRMRLLDDDAGYAWVVVTTEPFPPFDRYEVQPLYAQPHPSQQAGTEGEEDALGCVSLPRESNSLDLLDRWDDNWIIAKGRTRPDEPLYGVRLMIEETIVAEDEAETLPEAILAALKTVER